MKICLATFLMLLLGSASAQANDETERFCLNPRAIRQINGLGNFRFDGRISVVRPGADYGYAVIAEDQGLASWAQAGGIIRGSHGRIAFGVSNISNYPLIFRVHRIPDEATFHEVRNSSLYPEAMDPSLLARMPALGENFRCTFHLNGNAETGQPVTANQQCHCP